jgi:hypothetical protein
MSTDPDYVSQMIAASAGGDRDALERLIPVAHDKLRYVGGLSAEVVGISAATVKRDWRMAKAWPRQELSGGTGR